MKHRYPMTTTNSQTVTEKENEQLRLTIKDLQKEIEELKEKHVKSQMQDFEKSILEREIMNKLMNEQSNTILQLKKEIGRLKNRNRKLVAKTNDLKEECEDLRSLLDTDV